jgi:hypothetical protein
MEQNKEWHETKEGKEALLKALNERFSFTKQGEMIPKNEDSYDPIILSDYYGKTTSPT